jgi:hypothetical protein
MQSNYSQHIEYNDVYLEESSLEMDSTDIFAECNSLDNRPGTIYSLIDTR